MINVNDVEVDRGIEDRWCAILDEELKKPWGPDECKRYIELDGVFNKMRPLAYHVVNMYENEGWRVRLAEPKSAPDKYVNFEFSRPGSDTFF